MKIGELAQMAQCTVETIRYYEKEGLIPIPERSTGNYRTYSTCHVERLRFIRNCRALDMTHAEIHTLLDLMGRPRDVCNAVNHLLEEHIEHVDVRIAELQHLKHQLAHLRLQCQTGRIIEECGILHELSIMETEPKPVKHSHLD